MSLNAKSKCKTAARDFVHSYAKLLSIEARDRDDKITAEITII
jgi:hypothetical protein